MSEIKITNDDKPTVYVDDVHVTELKDLNRVINEIELILIGIDETETESSDGWWETSTGAEFGAEKLRLVLNEFATLKAENERLRRIEKIAAEIYNVANTHCECQHGNSGNYPTHAWWCDECFCELAAALGECEGGDE